MRRISADSFGTTAVVTGMQDSPYEPELELEEAEDTTAYQPGHYVEAVYDQKWYIGIIIDCSDEEDIQVKFMSSTQRSGSYRLTWPRHDNVCWVPFRHIICMVPA